MEKTGRYDKDGALGAILFIACKADGNPRTFKEVAKAFGSVNVTEQKIKRSYNGLKDFLELKKDSAFNYSSMGSSPKDFVSRICSELRVPGYIHGYANTLASEAKDNVAGKNPDSIAATSIFIITNILKLPNCTINEVAKASDVSTTTIYTLEKIMRIYVQCLPQSFWNRVPSNLNIIAQKCSGEIKSSPVNTPLSVKIA